MGKQYDMTFLLDARLGGGYSSAFKGAQSAMQQYREEYVRVSGELKNVAGYEKQEQAVENTKNKMALLQQQYDNIQREMDETGSHSSNLQNKLLDKQAQIDKTTAALQSQMEKLDDYRKKLQEAGANTDDLKNESSRLKTEMDELRKKIDESGDGADKFGESLTNLESLIATLGLTKMLKEAYAWFSECVSAAMEFEQAMAGVKRTVGGSDDFLSDLGDSFKEMSTTIPITTTELGTIAETAGQLGIAQELVEEFTLVMAELGTTTDLAADEAATMLAQFANITGITDYERLGSVVAALGDATATTASKVVEMSLGMAASASIAGMSERDILAIAAAVGSLGIESAAGSTAMSQLISTLYKATETGEKLEEIAAISGMSAEEFTTAWGTDAVGAMNTFIQGLTDVERNGKSAIVLLDELGINNVRQVKAILSLAQAGGLLSSTIEQANSAWDENTAHGQKAAVMYGTTQSKLVMMQNAYANVKTAIGDQFTPALAKVYEILTPILNGISEFITGNSEVSKILLALTVGVGAFIAVLTGLIVVLKLAKKAMDALTASMHSNPWVLMASVIAASVVALGTYIATTAAAKEETEELSDVSEEQQLQLRLLQGEYEKVCEAQGENSEAANELKDRISAETAVFEHGKETMEEYLERRKEVLESSQEQRDEHEEEEAALSTEFETTSNLIARLRELTEVEEQSAAAKKEIAAIVAILNNSIPELALNYDALTGTLNITPERLQQIAQAQYDKELAQERWDSFMAATAHKAELQTQLTEDQQAYDAAVATNDYYNSGVWNSDAGEWSPNMDNFEFTDQGPEWWQGSGYYDKNTGEYIMANKMGGVVGEAYSDMVAAGERVSETQAEIDAVDAELNELGTLITGGETESGETGNGVASVISQYTEEIDALTQSYETAYEAAYDSISGQYKLWDEVAKVSATSVDSVIGNLEKQREYWNSYNSNIQLLLSYSGEIDGLSEMVASFGDGSAESVNMIAGMAEAAQSGDPTKLRELVTAWQENKTAQDEAAQSLADLSTGYTEEMQRIAGEVAEDVAALDMSEDAVTAGENTIQGFIDGASNMLPLVREAYAAVANAASSALGVTESTSTEIGTTAPTGSPYTRTGYAVGTRSASEGWHLTGENGPELMYFYGGERVFTASETRDMLREYQAATTGAYLAEPIEAASAQSYGGVMVHFAPVYDISGSNDAEELRQVLAAHDEQLLQQLWELLTEERENAQRRAYR